VPRRWLHTAGAEGNNHINWRFPVSFSLAQIARRRITRPPVAAAVEVDDLTALAVAVGVLTSPTVRPARRAGNTPREKTPTCPILCSLSKP